MLEVVGLPIGDLETGQEIQAPLSRPGPGEEVRLRGLCGGRVVELTGRRL